MQTIETELFSNASNCAVVRVPGRVHPGLVIQGDSLSTLHAIARDVALRLKQGDIQDEELLYAAQELQEQLLDRLLRYQQALAAHGMELPYGQPASPTDLVRLVPDAGETP